MRSLRFLGFGDDKSARYFFESPDPWAAGEVRDCPDELATRLQDSYPDCFKDVTKKAGKTPDPQPDPAPAAPADTTETPAAPAEENSK